MASKVTPRRTSRPRGGARVIIKVVTRKMGATMLLAVEGRPAPITIRPGHHQDREERRTPLLLAPPTPGGAVRLPPPIGRSLPLDGPAGDETPSTSCTRRAAQRSA